MPPASFAKIASTVAAVILLGGVAWLKNQASTQSKSTLPGAEKTRAAETYDLGHDEELGGHTLQRHVGRTDEQLLERLIREPEISAASTYYDRAAAEKTVGAALTNEKSGSKPG